MRKEVMESEAIQSAVAAALYDVFHTARLSEHPADLPAYLRYADNLVHWLKVQGFAVGRAEP